MEGHGRVSYVVLHPATGFEQDILYDIAGVDSASHCLIESHLDQPADRFTMAVHQPVDSIGISVASTVEEIQGCVPFRPHGDAFLE
jgi:hypothetical protein